LDDASASALSPETFYRERLLAGCPPADAARLQQQIVIRLVPVNPADDSHFDSKAKEAESSGKKPPRGCPVCIWSACSVFKPPLKPEQIKDLLKYPNMQQMKFAAHVVVDEKSGLAKITQETGHISLWLYKSFSPLAKITKYETFP
jgi:hypothetical protein